MERRTQKRTQKTHARLLDTARALVDAHGYEALRTEELVKRAGVAKGTFFAHFADKDTLMDQLIGARIDVLLDQMEAAPPPASLEDLTERLLPCLNFMTSERYVFDVILRHSGAAATENIGPIARVLDRQIGILARWLGRAPFRNDVSPVLLAEGVQAFAVQTMALKFCALHEDVALHERLTAYLRAWLIPSDGASLSATQRASDAYG